MFSDFIHPVSLSSSDFHFRAARLFDGLVIQIDQVTESWLMRAASKAKLWKPWHYSYTDIRTGNKQTNNDKTEFVRMRSARKCSGVCGQRKASMTLLRDCCYSVLQTYLYCYKRFDVLHSPCTSIVNSIALLSSPRRLSCNFRFWPVTFLLHRR